MKRRNQIGVIAAAALVVAGLIFVFRPKPILVQTASIQRGDLREISEEEGITRMHDHFIVAATVPGRLRRIDLHAGDSVKAGQVLGWIDPVPIDPRQYAILQARERSAVAARQQADAVFERVQAIQAQVDRDAARAETLSQQGIISREALEKARTSEISAQHELRAAREAIASAAAQVDEARAALLAYKADNSDLPTTLVSPVEGHVLRVIEQSERVVSPGAPILEIGFTPKLEVVSDFLTREAVRFRPGMRALISDWGGEVPLAAHVRTVEPSAFTKVSSLGVEEQRVNVICDFDGTTDNLLDGYHVEVEVITWEGKDVLVIPASAVFRSGSEWAAFVIKQGRVHKTLLRIGHRGEESWEVQNGVGPGDVVIIHPSVDLIDGVRVRNNSDRHP